MLGFINRSFKALFKIIIFIALIVVVYFGFRMPLVLIAGLIIIILSAGLISIFIRIDDNLQLLVNDRIDIKAATENKLLKIENQVRNILKNINSDINKEELKPILVDKNKINEIYEILMTNGKEDMNEYIKKLLGIRGTKINIDV